MSNSILRSKVMWWSLIVSLVVLIIVSFYCIFQFHNANKYWKKQFVIADSQYVINFKPQKIILNDQMKKWLSNPKVREQKYYRVVVKGYGTHIQFLSGYGLGVPGVKHFFVSSKQISIQGSILKMSEHMFCGNWQLINITPEQYIFYIFKK